MTWVRFFKLKRSLLNVILIRAKNYWRAATKFLFYFIFYFSIYIFSLEKKLKRSETNKKLIANIVIIMEVQREKCMGARCQWSRYLIWYLLQLSFKFKCGNPCHSVNYVLACIWVHISCRISNSLVRMVGVSWVSEMGRYLSW